MCTARFRFCGATGGYGPTRGSDPLKPRNISGSSGQVGEGLKNMKSMRLPLVAIFLGLIFTGPDLRILTYFELLNRGLVPNITLYNMNRKLLRNVLLFWT